jgi:acetyltransferase
MTALMDVARAKGLKRMEGEVLTTNQAMLQLVTSLDFAVTTHPDDPTVKRVTKQL